MRQDVSALMLLCHGDGLERDHDTVAAVGGDVEFIGFDWGSAWAVFNGEERERSARVKRYQDREDVDLILAEVRRNVLQNNMAYLGDDEIAEEKVHANVEFEQNKGHGLCD
jgi:hypothetical protein